jgi:hypothetical protein
VSSHEEKVARQDSVDPWAEPSAASPTNASASETNASKAEDVFVDGVHFSAFGQKLVFQTLTERIRAYVSSFHETGKTNDTYTLDPELMDSDWPFGPVLRGEPGEWRDKMYAHARSATIAPTLRSGDTKSRSVWRVEASDAADLENRLGRGLAALAVAAGVGLGMGYALGSAARR